MTQTLLPGIEPRDSETEYGRMVLRLRERFGFAWVWKHAHWLEYGETLAVERMEARAEMERRAKAARSPITATGR